MLIFVKMLVLVNTFIFSLAERQRKSVIFP